MKFMSKVYIGNALKISADHVFMGVNDSKGI